ncbi:MAG TPA: type II toxin-antitoxin system RelE/ParE family toxin [Rhizobiaceae bacterium]|nr:type II toxin-antitoxin system RelE/ParE family toxin [Rhizobiaceae bacterium]
MKLSWTAPALVDVANIDRWLSQEADPKVALKQIERIRGRARRLRDFPQIGQQIGAAWRSVPVQKTPYILVYRIRNDRVEILRVRHNRQAWQPPE